VVHVKKCVACNVDISCVVDDDVDLLLLLLLLLILWAKEDEVYSLAKLSAGGNELLKQHRETASGAAAP
jgi:hypothetical protein